MENVTKELLLALSSRKHLMIEQLHSFCQINSGSDNLDGLKLMHQALQDSYYRLADKLETRELEPFNTITMQGDLVQQRCGDVLIISKRPQLQRRILLGGHMDTVFSASDPFQSLRFVNENCINGPGVADMKGGLIVMQQALEVFETSPVAQSLGWDVIINADEELGSPASADLFERISQNYQAALLYEPAMTPTGTLAKNRRGSGKFTLIAHGRASHVGRAFNEGRNAIAYLAEVIIAIHALNGQRPGVTINIGKIAGGSALNVVPEKAIAKLDVRISEKEDELWVLSSIQTILDQLQRDDYKIYLQGGFGRPIKKVCQSTERLFNRIVQAAQQLNLTIDWQDSGGCCDGNNLAKYGLPVIDTLGVRGGAIHSSDEFILLDSLVERAALSTLLLLDLAQGGLEELQA